MTQEVEGSGGIREILALEGANTLTGIREALAEEATVKRATVEPTVRQVTVVT